MAETPDRKSHSQTTHVSLSCHIRTSQDLEAAEGPGDGGGAGVDQLDVSLLSVSADCTPCQVVLPLGGRGGTRR